ncbi:MAG: pseudouridine synthase [Lachnospiraceae bacterium]|nr:pseudouridine synthase [Lachnospiraceae bacterium]
MRINQFIAMAGVCSRRQADRLIDAGAVYVNGEKAQVGKQVYPLDEVTVGGIRVELPERLTVFAYYKPRGIACTNADPHIPRSQTLAYVIEHELRLPVRVFYAGRLDMDSEGLLLLTNDGRLSQSLMRGVSAHEKEYVVTVDQPVTTEFIRTMSSGIYLEDLDITTRPCLVLPDKNDPKVFSIILTQGLNRQIRRMCDSLGYRAERIERIRILNIRLGNMRPGDCRELLPDELDELYRLT